MNFLDLCWVLLSGGLSFPDHWSSLGNNVKCPAQPFSIQCYSLSGWIPAPAKGQFSPSFSLCDIIPWSYYWYTVIGLTLPLTPMRKVSHLFYNYHLDPQKTSNSYDTFNKVDQCNPGLKPEYRRKV